MKPKEEHLIVSFPESTYVEVIGASWKIADEELNTSLEQDKDWVEYQNAVREHQEFRLDQMIITS